MSPVSCLVVAASRAMGMSTAYQNVKVCGLLLQERLLISSETQAVLDAERREDPNVKAILEQEVRSVLVFLSNVHLCQLCEWKGVMQTAIASAVLTQLGKRHSLNSTLRKAKVSHSPLCAGGAAAGGRGGAGAAVPGAGGGARPCGRHRRPGAGNRPRRRLQGQVPGAGHGLQGEGLGLRSTLSSRMLHIQDAVDT